MLENNRTSISILGQILTNKIGSLNVIVHSALKLEKKYNFKSTKTQCLQFQKWQKKNQFLQKKKV